jgi:hypothetical protein
MLLVVAIIDCRNDYKSNTNTSACSLSFDGLMVLEPFIKL